ncbi:amino acid transporter [Heterobasidion irregulare TC 32-1]|uniref:Amino acid transporter n=1 Tax=Heterobasidion irregulare (strain TC 32-1) TaxID=747525 RepID=W4K4K7_HETIT|nr:amino acid transporter [Heterobasidion irregulare TC 32-1]ETW79981.1 amino acid transporter [Heterobasidion irregulare TC 32-1]
MSLLSNAKRPSESSATLVTESSSGHAEGQADPADEDVSVTLGAPVETRSPLGRQVTLFSAITLNLGELLGSGIFSVPGVVLNSVGSVGLLLAYWVIAPIFACVALLAYTELASMFPHRSGAEVVFLEQAYPRPRFLVPISFAVSTVLLSFSATNSIVFAQYASAIFDIDITGSRQTAFALGVVTFCVAVVGVSTKWALRIVTVLTTIKILSLIFVSGTGAAVLLGFTHISDPFANFRNIWQGSSTNPNALATALVKTNFAFVGWANSYNVLSEVKGDNPVRTVRNAGLISLSMVTILFFLTNLAYVAAVPAEEIKGSGQLVAALFFSHVYGEHWAARILPVMVACSCVGNITVGQARVLREVARQGLLPYPEFFASTKPFGTPLAPVSLKCALTVIVLLALPAKDAFSFMLDLTSYPNLIFAAATAIGVWRLRRSRALVGLAPSPFRVSNFAVGLWLMQCVFLLVMPWVPPEHGRGDVSFWYATYCVVGLAVLGFCGLYYYTWIILLPRFGGYKIVEQIVELDDGARTTHLIRKYETPSEREPLLTVR